MLPVSVLVLLSPLCNKNVKEFLKDFGSLSCSHLCIKSALLMFVVSSKSKSSYFYPWSPEVEPWVFRWTFSSYPSPSPPPHHQLWGLGGTVLYCTVYCTVLYGIVLYCTVLYCTVLYCTVLYCTVLYCTVLYCTILYCIVLYCTVL